MLDAPPTPRVSVVIPCLNEEKTLGHQLAALALQETDFPWEVVIADNGSTDRTVEVARSFSDRLTSLTVIHETRRGRHHACNAGAAAARGELLVFVDGDDEVLPGFLQGMAEALQQHSAAAARIEHKHLQEEGAARGGYGEVQACGLQLGPGFLPFATGACLGVRRDAFEDVGGFDSMPFCEDADLSWKLQLAGYRIAFVPEAVLHYRQRTNLRRMYRQHRNYGEGHTLLYRKYARLGMAPRGWRAVMGEWGAIVRGVLRARSSDERARLVRRLGRAVGRLRGSVKHRVLYL